MSENRINFLLAAIEDTQGTIRAIDTKLIGIIALLILPISGITKITEYFFVIIHKNILVPFLLAIIFMIVFIFSWILSFYLAIKGISSIGNPKEYIRDAKEVTGSFYLGGEFKIRFLDIFSNRKNTKSSKTLIHYYQSLPKEDDNIIKELIFEQLKVAFIRDIKMKRQQASFVLLSSWLISGLALWVLYLFTNTAINCKCHFH